MMRSYRHRLLATLVSCGVGMLVGTHLKDQMRVACPACFVEHESLFRLVGSFSAAGIAMLLIASMQLAIGACERRRRIVEDPLRGALAPAGEGTPCREDSRPKTGSPMMRGKGKPSLPATILPGIVGLLIGGYLDDRMRAACPTCFVEHAALFRRVSAFSTAAIVMMLVVCAHGAVDACRMRSRRS